MCNGKREHLKDCSLVWRRVYGRESAIVVRKKKLGERAIGARWKDIRPGGSRRLLVERETPFGLRSHAELERRRRREAWEGLGGKDGRLNCWTLGK